MAEFSLRKFEIEYDKNRDLGDEASVFEKLSSVPSPPQLASELTQNKMARKLLYESTKKNTKQEDRNKGI